MTIEIGFDETRFTVRSGDYSTGPASALFNPGLHARAQEHRRRLSGWMRPVSDDDIGRVPRTTGYFVSRKYDGEFALLFFDGGSLISVNPGGTVRVGLPCFREAAEILIGAEVSSCVLAAELFCDGDGKRTRVHHVIRALRSSDDSEISKISLVVFDVLELNNRSVDSAAEVFGLIDEWFSSGTRAKPVDHTTADSLETVRSVFQKWVVDEGSEGLVVRHDKAGWFKIKQRHNLDVAVIGFSEGTEDRKGLIHDLLAAVMRRDGTFHELCRVGGGFSEEDRRILSEQLRQRIVASEYAAVNSNYVAYEMIAPGPVIEISCLDLISENSRGGSVNQMVLEFDGESFQPLVRMPLASVISPQFVRIRDDKEANVEDVGITQIAGLVDVPDFDRAAQADESEPSEIIKRVVYRKVMRGATMVRKLLLWKTNKEKNPEFPAFVVYLTDFSPNRKNPLERDIRITSTEGDAIDLFDELAAEKFVGGWEQTG